MPSNKLNPGKKWTSSKIRAIRDAWERVWRASNHRLIYPLELFEDPEFSKLTSVGCLRNRLSDWENDSEFEPSKAHQELMAWHNALSNYQEMNIQDILLDPNRKNVTGAIFLAKCKYGYAETNKIELSNAESLDDILAKNHKVP